MYIYIYIYIYIYTYSEAIHETGLSGNVVTSFFSSHNIYIYIYIYIVGGKRQINYKFIPTRLFRGCPLIREWVGNHETDLQE